MLSCREVSRLVSQSLDHKLSFRQRQQLRLHLLFCKLCSGFRRDLLAIRKAARREAGDPDVTLSPEARQRIEKLLEEQGDSPSEDS